MSPEEQIEIRHAVQQAVCMALSPWRSIDGAAEYLSVSRSYITKLRRDGKLPANSDGAIIRFKTSDLDALFKPVTT